MKILHSSLFASLSLLAACTFGSQSNNPDAGVYDDYYSESPTDDGAGKGKSGKARVAKTSTSTSTNSSSQAKVAKALKAKKPKVSGKKKKKKKKKKNNGKGKAAKFVFAGALPSAAAKGSVVEVFGEKLDQKNLMIAIGGKPQEIVEATEDRAIIKVTGGSGKLQLGKKPAKGKKFKAVAESDSDFEVIGKALGGNTNPEQGLIGSVYAIDGEVSDFPAASLETAPIATIAVDTVDINSDNFKAKLGGRNEWFAIRFQGSLNVTEAGDYTFCLNSDDGALLYLDEAEIINNDGAHEAATEVCESFAVDPGEYQLDLLKYQGAKGPMVLQFTWQKDGGKKVVIPMENLFPPEDAAEMAR